MSPPPLPETTKCSVILRDNENETAHSKHAFKFFYRLPTAGQQEVGVVVVVVVVVGTKLQKQYLLLTHFLQTS